MKKQILYKKPHEIKDLIHQLPDPSTMPFEHNIVLKEILYNLLHLLTKQDD